MSIEKLTEILDRQRLVGGLVHKQDMPSHEIVENLVSQQHGAEIHRFIAAASPAELGEIFDSIDLADAKLVWAHVPGSRQNDVLWEISDARRELLAGGREPEFQDSRVCVFELADGRLRQSPIRGRKDLEGVKPIWVDLVDTSRAEREYLGAHFGVELGDPLDETDLEVSSRFHVSVDGDVHLHSNFLGEEDDEARHVPVAFTIHGGTLYSVRNHELAVFRLQRQRIANQPDCASGCIDVLLDLYGSNVERSADSLEAVYETLGKVGNQVLQQSVSDDEAAEILSNIAEGESRNGRIRSNILDTQRAVSFLMRSRLLEGDQVEEAKQIFRNINSLNSHTAFLFDKINFLMDATIGFININQNRRVSQLTVFGVVFMPINILAGIGGMSEFSMMTDGVWWPVAYGSFLVGAGMVGYGTFVALKLLEKRRKRSRS